MSARRPERSDGLSFGDLPALVARIPILEREVVELRAEVEALKGREYRCACGSAELTNVKTRKTAEGVKRWKRCQSCGALVRTREVIAG